MHPLPDQGPSTNSFIPYSSLIRNREQGRTATLVYGSRCPKSSETQATCVRAIVTVHKTQKELSNDMSQTDNAPISEEQSSVVFDDLKSREWVHRSGQHNNHPPVSNATVPSDIVPSKNHTNTSFICSFLLMPTTSQNKTATQLTQHKYAWESPRLFTTEGA